MRAPFNGNRVLLAPLVLKVAQQRAQVWDQRLKLETRLRKRSDHAIAAQHRAHAGDPATPAHVSHGNRDQRNHYAKPGEQQQDVLARVLAAPLHETHVMQHHQGREGAVAALQIDCRHMQRPPRRLKQEACTVARKPAHVALDRCGKTARLLYQVAVGIAKRQCIQALVDGRAFEQRIDTCMCLRFEQIAQRLFK